jgi:formate/nitrite transporter FocA (FNT family)
LEDCIQQHVARQVDEQERSTKNTKPAIDEQDERETPHGASHLSAHQVFEGVAKNARRELDRPTKALAFSGLAGGMGMGLTGLAVAIMRATLGADAGWKELLAMAFYPLGFIAVIIGRAQLFTENTLYPVVLVLDERDHVLNTARLWSVVFITNVLGAGAFAWLTVRTGALRPEYVQQLVQLGVTSAEPTLTHIFWSGVIGGWIIALVAWMVTASTWTIGQIAVIWLLTFVVGAGHFAHCIATSGEILAAVWGHALPLASYLRWIVPATLGNILGGVVIVSMLNYGQVVAGNED